MKMYMHVTVGQKRYGGYFFEKAKFVVRYQNINGEWNRGVNEEVLFQFMLNNWAGKTAPDNLFAAPINTRRRKQILAADEVITKSHARQMAQDFQLCLWTDPWLSMFEACCKWCQREGRRRLMNCADLAPSILVTVETTDQNCTKQKYGALQLTPQAAYSLGVQLVEFARAYRAPDAVEIIEVDSSNHDASIPGWPPSGKLSLVVPAQRRSNHTTKAAQ